MTAQRVGAMLILLAVTHLSSAARNRKEDPDEVTFMALMDEEEEVTSIQADSADFFEIGGGEDDSSATIDEANKAYEGAEISNLMEIRTKLKFVGNKMDLRNPELVQTLADDISGQMIKHEGKKFLMCLHVGTTAGEEIKDKRPGFMEGRSETLMNALHEHDDALGVGENTILDGDVFEHFGSTRFAGLVMKIYVGETAPGCKKEDLVPPSA